MLGNATWTLPWSITERNVPMAMVLNIHHLKLGLVLMREITTLDYTLVRQNHA
jgi:hypothetical protein